jgi:hypothetical protein
VPSGVSVRAQIEVRELRSRGVAFGVSVAHDVSRDVLQPALAELAQAGRYLGVSGGAQFEQALVGALYLEGRGRVERVAHHPTVGAPFKARDSADREAFTGLSRESAAEAAPAKSPSRFRNGPG